MKSEDTTCTWYENTLHYSLLYTLPYATCRPRISRTTLSTVGGAGGGASVLATYSLLPTRTSQCSVSDSLLRPVHTYEHRWGPGPAHTLQRSDRTVHIHPRSRVSCTLLPLLDVYTPHSATSTRLTQNLIRHNESRPVKRVACTGCSVNRGAPSLMAGSSLPSGLGRLAAVCGRTGLHDGDES